MAVSPKPRPPQQMSPWVRCPSCGDTIYISDEYIIRHFHGQPVTCSKCRTALDWWTTARHNIEENFMYFEAFAFIGAKSTWFTLILQPGVRKIFKFSDHGVPAASKVLYVNYTPGGSLFPAELHGNVPTRRFFTDEVALYPVPATDQPAVDTELNVMVCWVPSTIADDSWQSLVDAFEAYATDRYAAMVVPANVAVESALSRLLTHYLERFSSKKRVEDFLDAAATYSHQLNVVLPLVASLNAIPKLPDHVRGALNRLRGLRNELAHEGVITGAYDKRAGAELLCGALFGFHYVRYVESRLPKQRAGS